MKLTRFVAPLVFGLAFSVAAMAATPVNVNTADAATLAKSLDGVGMSKAKAIVAYRKAHGPFKNASQLARVKGIGASTIEHNQSAIRVAGK
ncbi:MAG: helix-hairpin-helix domain-containing protein [Rhodanobacteraceae bacterium]